MHWIAGPLCLSLESGQHPDVWMTFPRRLDLPVVPEDSESTGGSHGVPWPMPCLSAILGLSGEREPSAASQGWAKDFRDIPDLPWLSSGYCTRSNMLQAIASNTQTWWGVLSFTAETSGEGHSELPSSDLLATAGNGWAQHHGLLLL